MKTIRTYTKLIKLQSFANRFNYLKLDGVVSEQTFGGSRYLNQILYSSSEWKRTRNEIIIRDNGRDLAHFDYPIYGTIYIHHLNPITIDDILKRRACVFDPENLISVSFETHQQIHYGNEKNIHNNELVIRKEGDTCLW